MGNSNHECKVARFFDEHLGSAVGAIGYVRGGWSRLLTLIPCKLVELTFAIASRQLWSGCRARSHHATSCDSLSGNRGVHILIAIHYLIVIAI
jgi:hypothetical protein